MSGLERLVTLEEVEFHESMFLDAALSPLSRLPKLKVLRLVGGVTSEEDWACIAQLVQLTTLDCSRTSPPDEGQWAALGALKNLQTFIAVDTSIRPSDLSMFKMWTELSTVDLSQTLMDATCMPQLASARSLKRLSLAGCYLIDGASLNFASFKHLVELNLSGITPSPRTIESMQNLAGLQSLNVSSTGMSAEAFVALAKLQPLRTLRMAHCGIKDGAQALSIITALRNLIGLDVTSNPFVDDAFVSSLVKLERQWTEVHFSGNRSLTAASLAGLQEVKSLQVLGLAQLGVLNDDVLAAIATLPLLRELDVQGSGTVSDKAISSLAGNQRLKTLRLTSTTGFSSDAIAQLKSKRRDMVVHME